VTVDIRALLEENVDAHRTTVVHRSYIPYNYQTDTEWDPVPHDKDGWSLPHNPNNLPMRFVVICSNPKCPVGRTEDGYYSRDATVAWQLAVSHERGLR
jgi:hypothetical protein